MKRSLIIVVVVLALLLVWQCSHTFQVSRRLGAAIANLQSYSEELSDSQEKNTAYRLTIDQLRYFNDSVFMELDATRRELKVKDNRLKALQQVRTSYSRRDTLIIRDTLFRDSSIHLDTLMGDAWFSARIMLGYPSLIVMEPSFHSVKNIVVSTRKDYVNPPKKWWIQRIFQKKQSVLQVDVIEKSPYIDHKSSRYIEVLH